jgi:FixJ family two-component response regulator
MNLQPTVLIVDDEKHTRDGLRSLLENEYDVYVAPDIAGAMNVLEREQIDVLLTDLRLGSEDGMTLIDRALKMPRPPACIMMTAYGSVDVAVEAMKRGAYDFVTKPLNLDKVELLIARAVQGRKLEQENRALREQVDERYGLENIWAGRAFIGQCAHRRRKRDGQGIGCTRHSQFEPAQQSEICGGALRGAFSTASGERVIRSRERRVHRRVRTAHRPVRAGERRHDFPRRSR